MKKRAIYSVIFSIVILAAISCNRQKESVKGKPGIQDTSWLEEITIAELRQGYTEGKYKVADVVSAYLGRIEEIDNNGPALNSIIIINPDAMAIAEKLDSMNAEERSMLPLFGVPVVIKDNIDTHDKMPNTAGATVLRNSYPASDSQVARKLREAGAVIIAKSNLSEWANFRGMASTSGWSGVGGQTKNPYVLDRNPCGSSSGSGVSVSANLCMVAIGTETNGSIVCPSNNNGIVGLKPTVGLISRTGIIPISFSQDTPGPMGRTVEDVATCLGTLTGIDSSDTKTLESAGRSYKDYRQFLRKDGLMGKRIGFLKSSGGFSDRVDTLMEKAVAFMKEQGAEIIEVEQPRGSEYDDASFQVLLYEFKDGLNKYFSGLGENAPVKNLTELIEFNKKDPVELRFFDQKILEMADKKGDLNSPEYRQALKKMLSATRENGIDKIMDSGKLDALIAPTGSPAWKTDLILGDHFVGGSSSLAAISGYPAITVPMGFIDELPVGITFFGKAWSESLLLEIAYSYEQGTKHRRAPKYLTTDSF
ncbi:MAG: amidase [Bacteroidales bacterium]|jgi:amidase|nr:amidase [Bacteroidales bacterium]